MKPAYEKVAQNLAGLAKVAAINCDDDTNKPFCGQMGVQGFPTLKIVKPGSKPGKPMIEDYQGARSAKAIVDAVVGKIPNHVKRLQDDGLDAWLEDKIITVKALLFTEKGTTSALIKSLAVDFLGSISFAQIRSKEVEAVEKYGIEKFPTLVLLPGDGKDPILYNKDMKREALVQFLSQVATPNPDPAPQIKSKSKPARKGKSSAEASSKYSKASEAHKSSDFDDFMTASTIVLDNDSPTTSPIPIVETEDTPIQIPDMITPIPVLSTPSELESTCLSSKSGNCILVLVPNVDPDTTLEETARESLNSLAEISNKYTKRHAKIFPFYNIPSINEAGTRLRNDLGLKSEGLEIISINVKRGWWKHYSAVVYDIQALESFIDSIKLGEGSKKRIPKDFGSSKIEVEESTIEEVPPAESTHDEL